MSSAVHRATRWVLSAVPVLTLTVTALKTGPGTFIKGTAHTPPGCFWLFFCFFAMSHAVVYIYVSTCSAVTKTPSHLASGVISSGK